MPLLTDEDVGIGQPTELSDADVGIGQLSDADVGLGPSPASKGENLFWNLAAGALKPIAHPIQTLEDANEAVVNLLKRAGVYSQDAQPLKLTSPLSPEQVGDVGNAVWNNTFGTPGAVPAPPSSMSPVERGVRGFATEAGSALLSPENVVGGGIGAKAAPELTARVFQAMMASQAPQAAKSTYDAVKRGDVETAVKEGLNTLLSIAAPATIEHELRSRRTLANAETSTPEPTGTTAETAVEPSSTSKPVEVTPDIAKDLIEQLTKGQIRVGEETRPGEQVEPPRKISDQGQGPAENQPLSPEKAPEEAPVITTPEPTPEVTPEVTPEEAPAPTAPAKPKPNPFWVRPRSDGVPDILDDIQELGGIRPPGPDAGGEYDGFKEAMTGTARILVKKSATHAPDTLIEELHGMGNHLRIESPDDLWSAIKNAVDDRQKLSRTGGGHEAQTVKFWSAVLDPKNKSGLERVNVQDLNVGYTFRIRGPGISHEELTVKHVDPHTGDIQVKDGPKLGVQDIPDGTQLWVQKGSAPEGIPKLKEETPLFGAPESIEDQKARTAAEAEQKRKASEKEELARRQAKPLEGRQGDIGQKDMFGGGDLFSENPTPYNLDKNALHFYGKPFDELSPEDQEAIRVTTVDETLPRRKQSDATTGREPATGGESESAPAGEQWPSELQRPASPASPSELAYRQRLESKSIVDLRAEVHTLKGQLLNADHPSLRARLETDLKNAQEILAHRTDEAAAHVDALRQNPRWMELQRKSEQRPLEMTMAEKEELQQIREGSKQQKQPSIGSGIKSALEKNKNSEGGFVRIPSKQELLDHFGDLPSLKDAAKWVTSKKRQLIERLKRGGDFDNISKLKNAAENLADLMGRQTGNVIRHELNRAFGVKADKVRSERNALREEALTFAIEAGGDKTLLQQWRYQLSGSEVAPQSWKRRALRAIDFADEHWDKLQPVAETYSQITDAENAYENANGIPTLYRKGGYVFHAQDLEKTYDTHDVGLVGRGAGGPSSPFRKGRDYSTYAEAIANGVHPKNLNAVDLMEHRIKLGQRVVNMGDWIDGLQHIQDKPTKLPVVVKPEWVERTGNLGPEHPELGGMPPGQDTQGYYEVPPHYDLVEYGGRTIGLHKGYAGLFNALTDASFFKKHSGWNALIQGGAFAKHTALLFDSYHFGRLAFWNAISRTGIPSYDRGLSILENTLPELQRMADRGEIPKAWGEELVKSKERLDAVMHQGGNLSGVGDNLHTEFLQRVPGIGHFNKWLFNKYQRGAMAEVALIEFERQAKMHPGEDMNTTARRVAKDVNTRFGNLQSQAWLKSKTGQDLARVLFLAPQWNESLIRSELGAVKQLGQAAGNMVRGKRPALGMLAKGIGVAILGTFVANQMINMATRGHPTWENPEEEAGAKISAWIPDKIGTGPGYFLNPMSLPAEMMNLLYRGIDRNKGKGAEEATSESVLSMLRSRMSPLAKGVYTWVTGDTPMGVKVGHGIGSAAKEAIPLPISGGAVVRGGKQVVDRMRGNNDSEEKFPGEFQKQIMQSAGIKTEQAPDPEHRIRNLAVDFNRQNKVKEDTGSYPPSKFADLIAAIRRQNTSDAKEAMDTILQTDKANGEPTNPKDIYTYFKKWEAAAFTKSRAREAQFRATLNPEQRGVYDQARKDRGAIAQKVNEMLKDRIKTP